MAPECDPANLMGKGPRAPGAFDLIATVARGSLKRERDRALGRGTARVAEVRGETRVAIANERAPRR